MAEVDGRLIVSTVDGDTNVLFEPAGYPVWSPDGNGVVAFELSDSDGNGRVDRIEAYVAESDGRRIRSLGRVAYRTLLFANVPGAFWSPDGQHFAYVGLITDPDTGATTSRAHIESMDSNAPVLTLGDDVTFFGWSPDGRHITYGTSSDCDGDGRDDSQNLWIAKPDGGSARDLGLIDRIQWRSVQLWSPDGTHIAYEALDGELLWSPDGSYVAYTAVLRDADGNRAGTQPRIERSNGIGGSGVIEENGNLLEWSRGGERVAYVAHYDDDSNGVVDRRALRVHTG
ncbi:TolB family protein [Candidatus Poriferisodalis sp.]|uniref:TolB family protein n=1 Tax=Candidatus Poriferisodalis sp. TaxID=3101277 RepID=UPI003D09D806